ncbi:MAG: Phosphomannomutase [Parcubacteria group bacterium GW2011_GWA2_49_9]|nr:MAG: Phosphomannomutase [Parcubacteria group bacterium GW2011_GWA2_49_9]
MATLNPTLFREYDIRGRENKEELNSESVALITRAFGTLLKKRKITTVIVGHDNRNTSEAFYAVAVKSFRACGLTVIGIGRCLTPMCYFAQYQYKVKGSCMITASHNPAGWNGFKLSDGYSKTLLTNDIQEIRRIAEKEDFSSGKGSFTKKDIEEAYIHDITSRVRIGKKLKVLINTANATSSFFSPKIFRKAGCEVVEHNTNPDPTFPNYIPNPANVEMMRDTGKQTVKHKADVGIGIDADGDRLGITDEKGATVWPDRYMILLSRLILEKRPGAKIVFDVKVSEALPEDIKAHGGVPIMWKTGHSYIKQKMTDEKAALAGEQSGHIFFGEGFYGFDDANFAALKLLEYIAKHKKPLSKLVAETPYYISTPAHHAHTDDTKKYAIVEQLTVAFRKEGHRIIDINGARVYLEDGWGLVRASSNLPALVIRFEAKTQKGVEKIEKIFRKKLSKFPEVATKWDSA